MMRLEGIAHASQPKLSISCEPGGKPVDLLEDAGQPGVCGSLKIQIILDAKDRSV